MSPYAKDRFIALACSLTLMIGALGLGIAPVIGLAIPSFVCLSMGSGIIDILRSLLTYTIAAEDISVVYSAMTILIVLGSSIAGPVYTGTFALGLRLGSPWEGLPFMVAGGLFVLSFVILFFVKRVVYEEAEPEDAMG
ncbi:hypothetical protein HYFRA_00010328 [Hymenoscyphus fraxineus]|uniref:Major facilitator superfamily (MFS) profile domain-containing protein n=1 Tax=Hymenoscyphus fraxineus TaxID=746836 RepID=A0A9N9PVC7_9HELO|nr:hypothetical protein HYFRA_00010328 [Hymenoscyphus fraxineus]